VSTVVVQQSSTPVVVVDRPTGVNVASGIGRRGPAGPAGGAEGATFTATAGATIHGRRVVRIADGAIFHPDTSVPAHGDQVIGISTQAGASGADVVVRTGGQMTDSGWAWDPGYVYCGPDGTLTQAPASTGWLMEVARVVNPTTISVDIEPPTHR
jgi:hypothetical protein